MASGIIKARPQIKEKSENVTTPVSSFTEAYRFTGLSPNGYYLVSTLVSTNYNEPSDIGINMLGDANNYMYLPGGWVGRTFTSVIKADSNGIIVIKYRLTGGPGTADIKTTVSENFAQL